MELKRKLTTLRKAENESMEQYLREVKLISDSLAAFNSPVSDQELVQYTRFGLNSEYENFVTTVSYLGNQITFDELRSHLIMHEQGMMQLRDSEPVSHQAFAVNQATISNSNNGSNSNNNEGGRGSSNNQQSRGRNNWRGRGQGGQNYGAYNKQLNLLFISGQAASWMVMLLVVLRVLYLLFACLV